MKRYLYMSQNELDTYYNYLIPYENTIYMRTIDTDPLNKEQIKEIVNYDGFSSCIKYNRLNELWDLIYSNAIDMIHKDQCKYLRTPIYSVYDNSSLYHMETGIEEFKSRFKIENKK